jgi:RNA polymerase sigma-70 factor (ECF subfamily)
MEAEKFNFLLRLIDRGDEAALVAIQQAYEKQIYWVAFSILHDWHYSRDIANEVMSTLFNKSRKFQNIQSPDACIYDLAKKASCDFYRKYVKKHKCEISIENVPPKDALQYLVHIDDYSNMDFMQLLSTLDDTEKEIVIKKISFNYTHTEIASDLKMPVGTIKSKYHDILVKLRKNLLKS